MKTKIIVLLGLLALLIIACSTPEETTKRDTEKYEVVKKYVNDVNLDIEKNISWVNLMPGSSPKFHVSGKITLLKDDKYSAEKAVLKYIKVFQNEQELYYIMPKVIEEIVEGNKILTYSTIKGLSIDKDLDRKMPVELELIFLEDKEELTYKINNVLVEEVH